MENLEGSKEESRVTLPYGTARLEDTAEFALGTAKANASDRELRARARLVGEAYSKRLAAIGKWNAAQQIAENQPPSDKNDSPEIADAKKEAAFRAIERNLLDIEQGNVPTGRHDALGSMWKQGGFESGTEAYLFMQNLIKKGPQAGLTADMIEFQNADWAGQVALAKRNRGMYKSAKSAIGAFAQSVADGFQTQALSKEEESRAPEDVRKANAMLFVRDIGGTSQDAGELQSAEEKVAAYRQRQSDEAIRAEYEMELNRKNAWSAFSSIVPSLGEDAQRCVRAMIESPDGALPTSLSSTFESLDEREQDLVIAARHLLKPHVEETVGNVISDAGTGAANIALNILTSTYRQGSKFGNMIANAAYDAGVDVNGIARTRNRLYEVTGSFFAGGDLASGSLPQMQFEQDCEKHGIVGEAVIGAISTLPYMYAASLKGGTALVAAEAMNEFDNHVALSGGDTTDPRYIASSFLMGGLYAYVEKLQVENFLGGIGEMKVREGLLKGFWNGIKNGTVPVVLTTETLSESLQEGLQNGIMAFHEAVSTGKDGKAQAFTEGFIEDFVGSLGTMAIVGAGGVVVGHMGRSGWHMRGNGRTSAAELRQASRSADLTGLYMREFAHNNMVKASARSDEYQQRRINDELRRLNSIWKDGGREALMKDGGVGEQEADGLEGLFKAMRQAEGSVVEAAGGAVDEWNKGRGLEASPKSGEKGDIGQQYLENLINAFMKGDMSRDDYVSRLMSIGFSEKGAEDYAAWSAAEREVRERARSLTDFLQSRYEAALDGDDAKAKDTAKVRSAIQALDRARNIWAKGMGIYRRTAEGGIADPGAKALEEFGFAKADAERLSRLFHYERAAAYSKVALDGIRAMYEKATKGLVSGKNALAAGFGGRVERLETGTDAKGGKTYGDFIGFNLPDGKGKAYVQIIETPELKSPDLDKAEENVAKSIAEATKNWAVPVTVEGWMKMTPEERRELWDMLSLEGSFDPDRTVKLALRDDPSASVDSSQAKRLVFGTITLATNSQLRRLANISDVADGIHAPTEGDTSAGFHETYHAWAYFMRATGQWTEKDEKALIAKYGEEEKGRHDEEAAANALRDYMSRRASGGTTIEDESSPFAKVYALAKKLIGRESEKIAQKRIAANAEEAFFDQIIADLYKGVGDLVEKPKPSEDAAKPKDGSAPQMPGRKESAAEAQNANSETQNANSETQNAKPETPKAETGTAKPAAKGNVIFEARTPTGGKVVKGHYEVVPLASLVHSNKPGYPMELQQRDRKENRGEAATRENHVENFDAGFLLSDPKTDSGAPIVAIRPDENGQARIVVVSGNGRTMVLEELSKRHLYDRYCNVMKKWAEKNGIEFDVADADDPVLVRVVDDLGKASLKELADLSNTNAIQQMNEEEQARADADIITSLGLAALYKPNADGTANMSAGASDDFFREFVKATGDTSLLNSDGTYTEALRLRARRALMAIAVGQGEHGRDTVKKLIEGAAGLERQKDVAAAIAPHVAAAEARPEYAIGPDVSRAFADYIDYIENKTSGAKWGNLDEYLKQGDMLMPRSEIAESVMRLLDDAKAAGRLVEAARLYAAAAKDEADGLLGAARTRTQLWRDSDNTAKETAKDSGPRFSVAVEEGISQDEAKDRLRSQRGNHTNRRTGITARLSADGAGKLVSNAAVAKTVANGFTAKQHNELAANIGVIFADASLAEDRPDRNGDTNIRSIKHFVTPVSINGQEAVAWTTVKESTEHGHRIYSVEGIKIAALSPAVRRVLANRNSADNAPTQESISNIGAERQGRFSIGGVFTGSAADYDKPSVKYIGTGEGSQVYGWGLYGSTERGVGESYATYRDSDHAIILVDGKEWKPAKDAPIGERTAYEQLDDFSNSPEEIAEYCESQEGKHYKEAAKFIRSHNIEIKEPHTYLYEQTFFTDRAPGDESHLLKWYEPIDDAARAVFKKAAKDLGVKLVTRMLPSGKKYQTVITREGAESSMRHFLDGENYQGELYQLLADATSPKEASEAYYRAGIDGVKYPVDSYGKTVKDGDKVGWNYVAFSDENIRVDHKWTDGQMRYSVSVTPEMRKATTVDTADMTRDKADAALRALAGRDLKNDETGIVAQVNSVQRRKILSGVAVQKSADNGFSAEEHNAAASIIEKLWKYASLGKVDGDKNGDPFVKSIKRFVSPVRLGDKDAYAYLTVKESNERGHRIYSIELEKLEALARKLGAQSPAAQSASVPEGTPRSIPQTGASAQGGRSFNGVTPEQDAAYADAVKRGDLETARRMEREVYERMGYSDDSSYQGTSAFNGAAPSRNAYFETKSERIEAAKNGEMEDTTTLGDFRDGIDVNNLQFIVFDPRSERNADPMRQEAIRNIRGVLDSGAKTITMYRSVPADVKETQFRNGDWITPSRAYAEENAQIHGWGSKFRIIEQEVSVEDVWWDGNDIAEWGFDDGRGSVYKNTAANRKLLGPTYDDAGNLIPLSKRFNDRKNDVRYSIAQTSTPEFKKWFGDSKVVDANGEPLVVYRRDNDSFTVFDFDKTQQNDAGWLGKGFYFYGDKGEAERATGYGKNLRSFYLKAENPYYITQEEYNRLVEADDPKVSAEFSQRLKDEGYDSVYWNGDLRQEWMVLEPSQIKSATDNIGTFDSTNPDIRYDIEGNIDEMLSRFDEAKGKTKEEIIKNFDNEQKIIGWLPDDLPLPPELDVAQRVVKGAQAYILNHLVNKPKHEKELTASDAKRMLMLINPRNEMRVVPQNGYASLAFIAPDPSGGWDCTVIAPRRGEFYIFKTMFGQSRKPYQDKPKVRFSMAGSSVRNKAVGFLIRGPLASLRDVDQTGGIVPNSDAQRNRDPEAKCIAERKMGKNQVKLGKQPKPTWLAREKRSPLQVICKGLYNAVKHLLSYSSSYSYASSS